MVDAYNSLTNTVYEFYWDFWHGNPLKFNADGINPIRKLTYGDLYSRTIKRQALIEAAEYNFIYIWETDFKNLKYWIYYHVCCIK